MLIIFTIIINMTRINLSFRYNALKTVSDSTALFVVDTPVSLYLKFAVSLPDRVYRNALKARASLPRALAYGENSLRIRKTARWQDKKRALSRFF